MFNLFNTLTPFYFWLDMGLWMTSSLILMVSLIALYLRAHNATETLPGSASAKPASYQDRAPRAPAQGVLEILNSQGTRSGTGFLVNLSKGGVGFLSEKVLPRGGAFMARFRLVPTVDPVTVSVRVVWLKPLSRGFLYGVQYNSLRPSSS